MSGSRTPSPTIQPNAHNTALGTPLGSQSGPANDKISVTVTTSQSIEMIDKPSYKAFVKLEDQTTSFASQGTVVYPVQHMTQACKRSIDLTLTMQDHVRSADWETLVAKDLFRLLKEVFPKAANASGQDVYKLCCDEAKNFNFDIFDQAQLVEAFVSLLQKLELVTVEPGDVKQAIKQLTREILDGVGGTVNSKQFLVNEVEKAKPSTLEDFCKLVLKTQHEKTKKIAMEAKRRGILPPDGLPSMSREQHDQENPPDEPSYKRRQTDLSTPSDTAAACPGCGRAGHKWKDCTYVKFKHPDANSDPSVAWSDTLAGREWSKLGELFLPSRKNWQKKPLDYGPLNEALRRK